MADSQKHNNTQPPNHEPRPPFRFPGVTSRVFPLRADIGKLKRICDTYFNNIAIPAHIARFQPAAPLVYLALLHYDQMFEEKSGKGVSREQSSIWVSQHELAFIIPMEWYQQEKGSEKVFKNWAFTIPFIFVSNPLSLQLGREIYGWPKLLVKAAPDIDQWINHPRDPSLLVTLQIAELGARQEEKFSPLLKIQMNSSSVAQLRPDFNSFAMFFDAPQAVLEGLGTMGDLLDLFAGTPLWNPWQLFTQEEQAVQRTRAKVIAKDITTLGAVWSNALRNQLVNAMWPGVSYETSQRVFLSDLSDNERRQGEQQKLGKTPSLDLITLKQFRQAGKREWACYQELVCSKIEVLNVVNGGLLGDLNYLRSDPTGGFELHLAHSAMGQQIIKSLGLEVSEIRQESDQQKKEEGEKTTDAYVLKPFYPFWIETNLRYGVGQTLCWRSGQTWHERKRQDDREEMTPRATTFSEIPINEEPATRYVTMRKIVEPNGMEEDGMLGKPKESKVTIRVYSIRIQGKIDTAGFLRDLGLTGELFSSPDTHVDAMDNSVYLIVMNTQADDTLTGLANPWEVAFAFPVTWTATTTEYALFSPFVYTAATNSVILEREVIGRPSVDAIIRASDAWLREDRLQQESHLTLRTESLPFATDSQSGQLTDRLLLKISQKSGPQGRTSANEIAARQASPFEFAKVLDPNISTAQGTIKSVTVKQFPDATNPEKKCYQAIVISRRTIKDIVIGGISEEATITLYENADGLIAKRLGFLPPTADQPYQSPVTIIAERSFTIQATMVETHSDSEDVLMRVHDGPWKRMPQRSKDS